MHTESRDAFLSLASSGRAAQDLILYWIRRLKDDWSGAAREACPSYGLLSPYPCMACRRATAARCISTPTRLCSASLLVYFPAQKGHPMTLYVGIDLGKRHHMAALLSTALLAQFGDFTACPTFAVE